ncbi:NADH-ubiquinone oxidoreductase 9.5 kDa subunit [Psilocybe cubensis]|uniref:NADH-ubiquinone oxidoreductase 9.5 kDa subunit n=2 Tax=Psilocybe cubensis TaxID=181762 RepID=A0A8H7Y3Q2_PSICU|nr:NADH-ubiquinone oxidoreductase 9.5 kDa subunit [Psilocybe cubensis]KAH9481739.1 NADH-ubiquinone oxidoreductase 9.5 kDa subunit [Psilocybe cubensis]
MSAFASPFRNTYRYLQRQAHESPVIFYSVVIGAIGPVMAVVVPPIRESMGYKRAEMIPSTYPIPNRPRRPTVGYEDP